MKISDYFVADRMEQKLVHSNTRSMSFMKKENASAVAQMVSTHDDGNDVFARGGRGAPPQSTTLN